MGFPGYSGFFVDRSRGRWPTSMLCGVQDWIGERGKGQRARDKGQERGFGVVVTGGQN